MNKHFMRFSLFLICALLILSPLLISGTVDAAETLYDDAYTLIAKTLHQSNGCTSTQGFAAGDVYLYSAMIKGDNTNAVIHRVHKDTGSTCLMINGATGDTSFTNLGHANDMDIAVVDGKEYLFVLASGNDIATGNIIVFEINDNILYQRSQYTLSYNGGNFNPSAMAVYKIDSKNVTFVFKWSYTSISTGSIAFSAASGDIPVTIKCYLDSTQVPINGVPRYFNDFANQGIDICGDILFATYAGCYDIETVYQSLILGFDLTKAPGTLQPEEDLIFYIESSDYPRCFEIEDCGISDDGKLYFNTNCWKSTSDTNHDGVFVLNDFCFYGRTISGQITSYNPQAATIIQLLQGDSVKYSAVIEAEGGGGKITQTFRLEDVALGTYDLVVTKAGHLPYTITGLTVGETDIDLTAHPDAAIADMTLTAGDINNDGCVDLIDVVLLTSDNTYSRPYEEAQTPSADLNGDGYFDLQDLILITSTENYNQSAPVVSFTQP